MIFKGTKSWVCQTLSIEYSCVTSSPSFMVDSFFVCEESISNCQCFLWLPQLFVGELRLKFLSGWKGVMLIFAWSILAGCLVYLFLDVLPTQTTVSITGSSLYVVAVSHVLPFGNGKSGCQTSCVVVLHVGSHSCCIWVGRLALLLLLHQAREFSMLHMPNCILWRLCQRGQLFNVAEAERVMWGVFANRDHDWAQPDSEFWRGR